MNPESRRGQCDHDRQGAIEEGRKAPASGPADCSNQHWKNADDADCQHRIEQPGIEHRGEKQGVLQNDHQYGDALCPYKSESVWRHGGYAVGRGLYLSGPRDVASTCCHRPFRWLTGGDQGRERAGCQNVDHEWDDGRKEKRLSEEVGDTKQIGRMRAADLFLSNRRAISNDTPASAKWFGHPPTPQPWPVLPHSSAC